LSPAMPVSRPADPSRAAMSSWMPSTRLRPPRGTWCPRCRARAQPRSRWPCTARSMDSRCAHASLAATAAWRARKPSPASSVSPCPRIGSPYPRGLRRPRLARGMSSRREGLCRSRGRSVAGHGARALVMAALLVAGCSRQAGGPAGPAAAARTGTSAASAQRGGRPPGATLAVSGTLFNGSDPDQIRAYLRTVREITPTKFDVQWSANTVAVSKDEAMRSLLGVSRDGSTLRFAAREPVVARIKPGSILWVYDIAVRRVDRVHRVGAIAVVQTSPASLTQAFTNADIEFNAAPNLADYYTGFRPHLAPARASALRRPRQPARPLPAQWRSDTGPMPGLLRVKDEPAPGAPDGPNADNPADNEDPDGDYGETRPLGDAHAGELLGFEYSMAYATRPDGATLYLEARKKDDGDPEQMEEQMQDVEKEAAADEQDLQKKLEQIGELDASVKNDQATLAELDLQYQKQLSYLQGKGDTSGQQALTQHYQYDRSKLQDQLDA